MLEFYKGKARNAIENNMSADIKLSKAQITKIIQSGVFLGAVLTKIAGPLMKVVVPFAKKKKVLPTLSLTAAMYAVDAGIQKKIHGSRKTTSNEVVK